MMKGLVLEGGGAKGSYQIGVLKAYFEEGETFGGVAGTSIGALNGALVAQGDFTRAYELWQNLSMNQLFNKEDEKIFKAIENKKVNTSFASQLKEDLKRILNEGGVDTSKMRTLIESVIDEDKLRKSPIDFALITVSLTDLKAYELFKERIPKGQMVDYIMASACFPGFKKVVIGDKTFVDGGLYNNSPVNLLIKKGYKDITIIGMKAPGITFPTNKKGIKIKRIIANDDLGSVMSFKPEQIKSNIRLGYWDGKRALHNYQGKSYYLKPGLEEKFFKYLGALDLSVIKTIGGFLKVDAGESKRAFFEEMLPILRSHLKLDKDAGYQELLVAALEVLAVKSKIERFYLYDFEELLEAVKKKNISLSYDKFMFLRNKDKALECLIKNLN